MAMLVTPQSPLYDGSELDDCSSIDVIPPDLPDSLELIKAEYQWYEMVSFWRAYRLWLAARGYNLYELRNLGAGEQWSPPSQTTEASLPYARRAPDDVLIDRPVSPNNRIAPAQDVLGRDVMLKLVEIDSVEYRINRTLLDCPQLLSDKPHGVLAPVAILMSPYGFAFIVMPRWQSAVRPYLIESLNQVITYMQCLLKGLVFLHNRRIAHRDIDYHNTMVNFYCTGCYGDRVDNLLSEHLRGPDVAYTLMDFDLSLQCAPDISLRQCRVPLDVTWVSLFVSTDLYLAPLFYNPFAFDVACLGNLFRYTFSELVPRFPLLAPLFDKMTTPVISQRFTAEDALNFLEHAVSQLSEEERNSTFILDQDSRTLGQTGAYWALLPASFHEIWKDYKTLPQHWGIRILYYVTDTKYGWRIWCFLRGRLGI